jgi:hypothetical protein
MTKKPTPDLVAEHATLAELTAELRRIEDAARQARSAHRNAEQAVRDAEADRKRALTAAVSGGTDPAKVPTKPVDTARAAVADAADIVAAHDRAQARAEGALAAALTGEAGDEWAQQLAARRAEAVARAADAIADATDAVAAILAVDESMSWRDATRRRGTLPSARQVATLQTTTTNGAFDLRELLAWLAAALDSELPADEPAAA